MGCGSSTNTAVHPLAHEEVNVDEDETGSKLGNRGDSAVSKGTTDSGVVMENKEIPVLPGAVPRKQSEKVRESVADNGLLQHYGTLQERQKSSDILEELLNQGIIPIGQSREKGNMAGEAYSIMLDERDEIRRRPPARLESLRAKNVQSLRSREEIEEKIRLAEERRKTREVELKTRLRTKSARVRVPVSNTAEDEDTTLTPVMPLQSPLTSDSTLIACTPSVEGECVREDEGDGKECDKEMGEAERREEREQGGGSGGDREQVKGAESGGQDGDEDELRAGQPFTASGELETDSTFQHAEDNMETF